MKPIPAETAFQTAVAEPSGGLAADIECALDNKGEVSSRMSSLSRATPAIEATAIATVLMLISWVPLLIGDSEKNGTRRSVIPARIG